jgi:hypothetical protein
MSYIVGNLIVIWGRLHMVGLLFIEFFLIFSVIWKVYSYVMDLYLFRQSPLFLYYF